MFSIVLNAQSVKIEIGVNSSLLRNTSFWEGTNPQLGQDVAIGILSPVFILDHIFIDAAIGLSNRTYTANTAIGDMNMRHVFASIDGAVTYQFHSLFATRLGFYYSELFLVTSNTNSTFSLFNNVDYGPLISFIYFTPIVSQLQLTYKHGLPDMIRDFELFDRYGNTVGFVNGFRFSQISLSIIMILGN